MNVCKITYYHPALDGRIFYKEAISLKKMGHDITIIVPLFDHKLISNGVEIPLNENDETTVEGIKLKAIRQKYIKIPVIGYMLMIRQFKRSILSFADQNEFDIYHCHDHKIALHAFIALMKRDKKYGLKHTKFIFDSHEFYPGQAIDMYKGKLKGLFFLRWMKRMDILLAKYVDQVIAVSEASRLHYLLLNKYLSIDIISNLALKSLFTKIKPHKKSNIFTICHEGKLSFDRGLKELVNIVEQMNLMGKPVKLKVIGSLPEEELKWLNKQLKKSEFQECIDIRGWVDYKKIGYEISSCHIGVVTMQPLLNNIFSISNKFYNYLMAGLPVVAIKSPEMDRIISTHNCGFTFQFGNYDEFFESIKRLYSDGSLLEGYSQNAKFCSEKYYNWDYAEKVLYSIYDRLESQLQASNK